MTETKPTNGLLTDQLNNTRTKDRPIWLTIDGSKPTNDWWQTLHKSFSQYHHGYTDQSRSTDQTYNIIDWQTPFTWLWRWLPLRLLKHQSPTTVLFRITLTWTITLYELRIAFLAKYPFISKKYANSVKIVIWWTILLSKFESLAYKTTLFFRL